MKESGKDRLKQAIYEHPSTAARSHFPNGVGKEEGASPPQKEANPALLRSAAPSKGRGSRGHSLLPMEGGAPKGRRLDGGSGMKKSGKDRLKYAICESSAISISSERIHAYVKKRITTDKAFPAWGRWRAERAG